MPAIYKARKADSEATKGKTASNLKLASHPTSQESSIAPTSVKDSIKDSGNQTSKGASRGQNSPKDENPSNRGESRTLNSDVSIDDMAKEVMALVQKSKERRQKNILRKKRTCYSSVSQAGGKGKLSESFEYSEDEEDDGRSRATDVLAKMSSSVVTRTRQIPTQKQQQGVHIEKEVEDEQSRLKLCSAEPKVPVQPTGVVSMFVPGGTTKTHSSHDQTDVMSVDNDRDLEEKVQSNMAADSRELKSGAHSSTDCLNTSQNNSSRDVEDSKSAHLAQRGDKGGKKGRLSRKLVDGEEEVEMKQNLLKRRSQSAPKDPSRQSPRRKVDSRNNLKGDGKKSKGTKKPGPGSSSTNSRKARSRSSKIIADDEAEHLGQKLDHSSSSQDSELSKSISDFDKDGDMKRNLEKRNTQSASKDHGLQNYKGKRRGKSAKTAGLQKEKVQVEAATASTDQGEMRPWSKEEIEKLHEYESPVSLSVCLCLSLRTIFCCCSNKTLLTYTAMHGNLQAINKILFR